MPNRVPNDKATAKGGRGTLADRDEFGCTPLRRRFVLEYMVDRNGTRAAMRAGYGAKRAHVTACNLLKLPEVQSALRHHQRRLEAKLEVTAEATLRELGRIAFFDLRRVFRDDGTLKSAGELDDETAAALASIEHGALGIIKIKAHAKAPALEALAKHFGLYKADNAQVADAVTALLREVADRGSGLPVKP